MRKKETRKDYLSPDAKVIVLKIDGLLTSNSMLKGDDDRNTDDTGLEGSEDVTDPDGYGTWD